VRQKNNEEALVELRRAAELAPNQAHYGYVLGVGLHSAGRVDEAISVLKDNLGRHPADRESLLALITFNREAGNFAAALEYATRLGQIAPDDPRVKELINLLKRRTETSPR
jgi:Flp pilus assembly protein TadD